MSIDKTKSEITFEKTTKPNLNQLLLPLIYSSEHVQREGLSRRGSDWNLDQILEGSAIPTDQKRSLRNAGIQAEDFVAWLLYAYSGKGRGIEKPAFFATKRLLEKPPVLAPEEYQRLAKSGSKVLGRNLAFTIDPLEGLPDPEWGGVMGSVSSEKLRDLAMALSFDLKVEDTTST
jgi:hypothetical protein